MTLRPIRRALLSVSDKTGLVDFAKGLARHGVALISTGGTAKALRDAGLAVSDISELTGFPEMMDGRVKTLHPKVHGGLLALRDKKDHADAMKSHGIEGIDLLVSNLYPFEATVAKGADFAETIEQIDIGGPAMTRSAAKNHDWVTVIVDSDDYAAVLAEMDANKGATSAKLRRKLAQTAFARTAAYDSRRLQLVRRRTREGRRRIAATASELRRYAAPTATLWRKSAPASRVLRRRRNTFRRRDGRAGAGPRAQLHQHPRHRRGVRTGGGVRFPQRPSLRHHQARQSLRRRARQDIQGSLSARSSPAIQ